MFNTTRTPKWLLTLNKTVSILATLTVIFNMSALGVFLAPRAAEAANPSANLDQCRNGSAASPNDCLSLGGGTGWVNGNAGSSQAHYVEGMSIPYRAILEDLPTGSPITITFGYDIKHSGAHAIDFLTSYNRLSPHTDFGHAAEAVNPVSGVSGIVGGANTFTIPAPSSAGSPVAGQPTTAYNALPGSEKLMSIWNGTISNIAYLSQGDLNANQAETQINVTFTPTQSKVVLSWGGHIGSRLDWGLGNSAGGISGSPYHMRLIGWSIGNLGQQDRSLSAAAVTPAPIPGIEKTATPLGATNRDTEILYTITYGNSGNAQTTVNLTDTWSFGSDVVATYVAGSATNAYGGVVPVVNTGTKTITWSNIVIPAYTVGLTVSYKLKTNVTNANAGTFHVFNQAKLVEGTKILTTTKTDNWVSYACVLGITKSVNATNAKPGDTLTYTLNYQNTGTANCTGGGVRVDDVIPTGTTYTGSHTEIVGTEYGYMAGKFGANNPGFNGSMLSWNAHDLTPGESGTVTYNVTVNAITYCTESDIPNTAKIYSDQFPNGITSNQVSTHIVADCLGKLKVTKVVDKGNLTPDNWSFTVGNVTLTPAQGTDYVEFTLPAGTYTATESSVAGYHEVSNTCQNVLVTPNQTATCEFHNAQDVGQLTVIKHVVGSSEPASSWTMNVAGNTPLSFPGDEAGTTNEVIAGDYTVTESAMTGYTLSYSGDCDLNGNVTIAHGDDKTCTLTNTRDTGRIIVYKNVDTDGDGDVDVTGATNWTWDITGGSQNIATGTGTGVDTGSYTISEDQQANYHVTDLTCDNQSYGAVTSGLVTVAKDQVVECTFTNTRDTGDLRIKKYEDTNGNGSKDANEPYLTGWDFTVSQNAQTVATGTTNVNDSNWLYINDLPTGSYDVTETLQAGWINTDPGTTPATKQVSITKDQLATVWFGNFELGKISGYKWNDVNGDGQFTDGTDYVLPGWFICLNGDPCVQTDQNGYYEFTGLTAGSYTVTETLVPGWTATFPLNSHIIEILSGSDVRADFFNFQNGKISGYKWNDLNGNGTWEQNEPGLANWTISLWKNAQFYGNQITDQNGYYEFDQLQVGSYAVSEDESNAAWVRTSSPATYGPLNMLSGSNFPNNNFGNFKTPTLTVIKHVVNDDGGNAVASDFTMNVTGTNVSDPSFPGDENGTTVSLWAGSYDVNEIEIDGYEKSIGESCEGTVQSGDEITCTITNDDVAPTITLYKEVINNNGGNASENDFGLTIGGGAVSSGQTIEVDANTPYALDEAGLTGYSFVSLTGDEECPAVLGGTVTADEGEDITCTITNNDLAPTITLIKEVINNNGGNAQPNDFNLTVGGSAVVSGQTVTVDANTPYALDETQLDGYTFVSLTGEGCPAELGGTVTLNEGQNVTCTITNDDVAPTITLIKEVQNDNGGNALPNDFNLTIGGVVIESGVTYNVNANTAYGLNETQLDGYTFVEIKGDAICPAVLGGEVTLDEGEDVTCTIVNNDEAPSITLYKEVINNNGGNANENDFGLTIGGTPVTSGQTLVVNANTPYALNEAGLSGYTFVSLTGDEECPAVLGGEVTLNEGEDVTCTITNDDVAPTITLIKSVTNNNGGNAQPNDFNLTIGGNAATSGTTYPVNANTPYALNETLLSGYSFVSLSGDAECPQVLGGTVTADEGENITCTITNDDIAPSITLIKNVINNNGGTATENDFGLTIGGNSVTSGVTNYLDANTAYALNEAGLFGYTFVSLTGDAKCPAVLGGEVTLDEGENITCTITNDDVTPELTVIKHVINDNGGNAVASDFTMNVTGTNVSDESFAGAEAPGTTVTINQGSFSVDESEFPGYAKSFSGDCSGTINVGEDKTCTITNDDIAPQLTLIKEVDNDNGGDNLASEWILSATGEEGFSGTGTQDAEENEAVLGPNQVKANVTYTLSESGPSGYEQSSWSCIGGTYDNGTVTLAEGETATCTITNDDQAPTITLIKNVINDNGGSAEPNDFQLTIGGNSATSGTTYEVDANTAYALNETQVEGYSFVEITGDEGCPSELGGTVTLNEGENITCTITNDDIPGRVVGYKYEDVNHNSEWDEGENGLENWTFYLRTESQTGPIAYTTTSDANGFFEFTGVNVGSYFLTEELPTKWDQITPESGYYLVDIVPGYDNGKQEAFFLFGNAEQVTLNVDKQADKDVVQAEETITYRIDWSVSGNSVALNVLLVDTIPVELIVDTTTISDGGVWDSVNRTITWDFGTQAPNASGFVTYQAKSIVPIANGTEIHNVARLSADNSDPLFDEDDDTVRVVSDPVLGIEKTVDIHNNLGFVNPEATVTYTVVVTNTGTDTAYNVTLTDTLPSGFLFADTLTPSKVFNLGDIAVGGSVTTTYDVIVGANVLAGSYDNLAVARADNHDPVDDTVPVVVKVPVPQGEETEPELVITKKADVSIVNPGGTVNYTIEVKNIGDGAALNVMLTDTLPSGFTYEDGTSTKTWALGTIAPGLSQIVTYKVKVATNATAGTKENIAIAKADNHGSVEARAQVLVKVPQVLGATTGASMGDLMIFLSSMLIIFTGMMFIRQGRRQTQSASQ